MQRTNNSLVQSPNLLFFALTFCLVASRVVAEPFPMFEARPLQAAPQMMEAQPLHAAPMQAIEARTFNPAPMQPIEARAFNPVQMQPIEARTFNPAPMQPHLTQPFEPKFRGGNPSFLKADKVAPFQPGGMAPQTPYFKAEKAFPFEAKGNVFDAGTPKYSPSKKFGQDVGAFKEVHPLIGSTLGNEPKLGKFKNVHPITPMAEKALPLSPKVGGILGGIADKGALSDKPIKKLPGLPGNFNNPSTMDTLKVGGIAKKGGILGAVEKVPVDKITKKGPIQGKPDLKLDPKIAKDLNGKSPVLKPKFDKEKIKDLKLKNPPNGGNGGGGNGAGGNGGAGNGGGNGGNGNGPGHWHPWHHFGHPDPHHWHFDVWLPFFKTHAWNAGYQGYNVWVNVGGDWVSQQVYDPQLLATQYIPANVALTEPRAYYSVDQLADGTLIEHTGVWYIAANGQPHGQEQWSVPTLGEEASQTFLQNCNGLDEATPYETLEELADGTVIARDGYYVITTDGAVRGEETWVVQELGPMVNKLLEAGQGPYIN